MSDIRDAWAGLSANGKAAVVVSMVVAVAALLALALWLGVDLTGLPEWVRRFGG